MITIYTDGSCDTKSRQGAWGAIILPDGEKIALSGKVADTTHQRMELSAVIEGITYVQNNFKGVQHVHIYSDSQYVTGLMERQQKLSNANFITSKGTEIRNVDLVKKIYLLGAQIQLTFTKVKAHQKPGNSANHNIDADKLVRKIMRQNA
jgi:ribonuclease HI